MRMNTKRWSALLLGLALLGGVAEGAVPPKSVNVTPSEDGGFYLRDPDGNPGSEVPISFAGLAGAMTNAGINNGVVGSGFSANVCPNIFGDQRDVCVLAIVPKSGDDPVTEGWAIESSCAGDDEALLTHDGGETGSGVMALSCTADTADESSEFAWSFAADPTPDEGYDFGGLTPTGTSAFPLDGVPTFHNISLYWKEGSTGTAGNNTTNQALCRFRVKGTPTWFEAMPLRWDNRAQGTAANQIPYGFKEFRGSILEVASDTIYQIECLTETSLKLASVEVRTWDETPPEDTPIVPSATSNAQLTITTGGTPSAYKVYRRTGGFEIDRNNAGDGPGGGVQHCISVNAPYVIIDGA
jgi:hypothetical protein